MFIITGNKIKEQKVRVLDTTDMQEEWCDYSTLERGIQQGLDIKGLDINNNIICQYANLGAELANKWDFMVSKTITLRNKNAILDVLKPYGLAFTEDDILVVKENNIQIRLQKVNKVITKNHEASILTVDPKVYKATALCRNIAIELLKLPIFNQDGLHAYLTHIVTTNIPNTYLALMDNVSIELELQEISENAIRNSLQQSNCEEYTYYLNQLLTDVNKDASRSYFISKYMYHHDISTEAMVSESNITEKDVLFGNPSDLEFEEFEEFEE